MATALFAYLGRFDQTDARTGAFKRVLVGVVGWALFDLTVDQVHRTASPEVAFQVFRYLSFLFLGFIPACGELIVSLYRPVTGRDRALIYGPFGALYLAALVAPQAVNPTSFNITVPPGVLRGWWNITYKAWAMVLTGGLLARLFIESAKQDDRAARAEMRIMGLGGAGTLVGIVLAQMVRTVWGAGLPWLANLATVSTSLAAFWGLKRYGRLLATRNVYQATLQATPNGVIHLVRGRIGWVNHGFLKLSGLTTAERLKGRRLEEVIDLPPRPETGRSEMASRLESGRIDDLEVGLERPDGRKITCLLNSAPFENRQAGSGSVVVLTDITELKRAEAERRETVKLEGAMEMAGAACHELNQPLQAMSGQLDLLNLHQGDNDIQARVEAIFGQFDRLTAIIAKIERVTRYRTRGYATGTKIIDLNQSSDDD